MRVEVRGYNRDSGPKVIFDENITEAEVRENIGNSAAPNTLLLEKSKSDGSIKMRIGPRALSGFGGSYNIFIQLTEDDIAKLVLEWLPHVQEVIKRLPPRKLGPPAIDIYQIAHDAGLNPGGC
jgi:hypothetical protein